MDLVVHIPGVQSTCWVESGPGEGGGGGGGGGVGQHSCSRLTYSELEDEVG